jgi:predicted permease
MSPGDPAGPRRPPPAWLENILARVLPDGLSGEATLGDLAEEYDRKATRSRIGAGLWYAAQAASLVGYRVVSGSGTHSGTPAAAVVDLRWAFRSMARHPGFALGIVAVLGLGFGANVAVYSVVDGTLANSSWWSDADRTLAVWPERTWSFGNLELFQDDETAFRTLGAYLEGAVALEAGDESSRSVNAVAITPALFRELAIQPVVGRPLDDDDGFFGAEPVVVLGEGLWQRAFGGDPAVVGSTVRINGAAVRVVGIQGAAGNAPGGRAELWFPLVMDPRDDDYFKAVDKTMVGVLRTGATPSDAQADLDAFTVRLSTMFPTFYPVDWATGLAKVARADAAQRREIQAPLLLLLAGTALLVLLTALNVGNLLLGRAIDRRRELAIRSSLGAGRGRIVRQLLVEGAVLTGLGLALGLVVAQLGGRWIVGLFVEEPIVAAAPIGTPAVLAFALGLAAVAGLLMNGVPIAHFLRSNGRRLTLGGDPGHGIQRGLVTVQAALATLLLVSATLFVSTVDGLRRVPLGFEPEGLLAVELSPPADRVASTEAARGWPRRLVEEARALPGVLDAGLVSRVPLRSPPARTGVNLESSPVDPREATSVEMHRVDPGFFGVFGVAVVEGRALDARDVALDSPSVVVINRAMADELWPGGDALGQRIAIDPHAWDRFVPIVGVVENLRSDDLAGPMAPALYVALAEQPAREVTLVVRADDDSGALGPVLRSLVGEVDPLVPVRSLARMTDVVRAAYATSWVLMGLLTLLAVLATALGALGTYAVMAHHVSLNARSIGVRMALGAPRGTVVVGVVRSGVRSAGLGIVAGCAAAWVAGRFLESVVAGTASLEPSTFVAPVVALLSTAAVAAWIPATRAGRLAPAEVLRGD